MELNTIRRITIQARTEGTEQAAASLRQLSAAQKDVAATGETVATVTDISSRKQLSASQAYERLMRSMDLAARAQYQFSQGFRVLDAVAKQGAIGTDQYLHSLELLYQRYAAATNQGAKGAQAMARETGALSFEARNLSFQIVDVTQGILSGQSAFMIFAQQAGQIGQVIATSPRGLGGLMRELGASIASVITPMRLAGAAVVGLGAAAYGSYSSWKSFALALDDTARTAGMATDNMARLQIAASFRGVGGADFSQAMAAFSQSAYEARNNFGSLAEVFRANGGLIPSSTEGALNRVADLIKNAGSDIARLNILRQAGLPSDMEWVRLMSGGAEGLKRAKDEAAALSGSQNEMVRRAREFDEAWNKAWANWGVHWRSATVGVLDFFERMQDAGRRAAMGFGIDVGGNALKAAFAGGHPGTRMTQMQATDFYNAFGNRFAAGEDSTRNKDILRNNLNLEQQRIGILGELATVADRVRQKEIEIQLARLSSVPITKDAERALLNLATAQALASKNQEAASLGLFSNARAQAQLNAELQAALDKKLLDPANLEQYGAATVALQKNLIALRDQAALAGTAFEQLKRMQLDAQKPWQMMDQFAAASLNSMTDNLAALVVGTKSAQAAFRDFTQSVLTDLAKLLIRQNITGPLAGFLSTAFRGFGGGFGGFEMKFPGGLPGSAQGNVFYGGNVVPFARGGVVSQPTIFPMARGAGLMGEAGPEAVMPLRRLGNGDLGVQTAGGGAAGRVQVEISVSVDDDGKLAVIARQAGEEGGQRAAQARVEVFSRHELPGRMQQIQRNPRRVG